MSKLIGWLAWLVVAVMGLLTFSGIITVATPIIRQMPMPERAQDMAIILMAFLAVVAVVCMMAGALTVTDRVFNRRLPWHR